MREEVWPGVLRQGIDDGGHPRSQRDLVRRRRLVVVIALHARARDDQHRLAVLVVLQFGPARAANLALAHCGQ
jgi:hypothetical protein